MHKNSVASGIGWPTSVRSVRCRYPGQSPITGSTRCPISLPPSSYAAIRMLASSGSTTFLNTNGSSSYTGLMPLSRTILVRNFLRTVSAGSPNMSTSTYVPTFLSVRNWPDMTVTITVPAMIPSTCNRREKKYEHKKWLAVSLVCGTLSASFAPIGPTAVPGMDSSSLELSESDEPRLKKSSNWNLASASVSPFPDGSPDTSSAFSTRRRSSLLVANVLMMLKREHERKNRINAWPVPYAKREAVIRSTAFKIHLPGGAEGKHYTRQELGDRCPKPERPIDHLR
uniref:Uncharacterized protein n=1 Tax=Anopheles farauti TaxID=69004 RepID=A0A182QX47_9DIPT